MSLNATLNTYGQIGVDLLRDAIEPLSATGKTAQSIRYEVKDNHLLFYARGFFELLERGIKPSGKNPSPAMIAQLTEYAKARGFENPKSAAWAIAKKILSEGDKTHKRGGRVVYSDVVDQLMKEMAKDLSDNYKMDIINSFKKIQ